MNIKKEYILDMVNLSFNFINHTYEIYNISNELIKKKQKKIINISEPVK